MENDNKEFKKLPFREKMKDKEYRTGYYLSYLFFFITLVITWIIVPISIILFAYFPFILLTGNFINLALCLKIYNYMIKKNRE